MIICNYYYFIYYLVADCQSDSSSSGFNGVTEVAANDYTMPMNHRHQAKLILRHENRILKKMSLTMICTWNDRNKLNVKTKIA